MAYTRAKSIWTQGQQQHIFRRRKKKTKIKSRDANYYIERERTKKKCDPSYLSDHHIYIYIYLIQKGKLYRPAGPIYGYRRGGGSSLK